MRRRLLAMGLLTAALLAPLATQAQLIADVARPSATIETATHGKVEQAPADGDGFRPIHFGPGPDTGGSALILAPSRGERWDWSAATGLRMHLQNAMPWAITVVLTVEDAGGQRLQARLGLPPGGPLTTTLPLAATSPRRWGMTAGPPVPGERDGGPVAVALQVEGKIDPRNIRRLSIGVPTADARQTLRIGKVFLAEAGRDDEREAYAGIVDRFGQYQRGDWPGKIKAGDDSDFAAAVARVDQALEQALAALPPAGRHDRLGGLIGKNPPRWLETPRGKAGYFRTGRLRQSDGRIRHVLVTPDGHPFFSLGVNAVQRDNSATYVEGRRFMFTDLPTGTEPAARFIDRYDSHQTLAATAGAQRGRGFAQGERFDFYRANLWRRHGQAWQDRWLESTRARLQAWGFNTIGAWSDEVLRPGTPLPWTAIVHVDGEFARLSDGRDWWAGIADPFDPAFARAVDRTLAAAVRGHETDSTLIGYFIDNEPGFGNGAAVDPDERYAIARAVLAMDGRQPQAHAKRAFVEHLRQRHGDIGRLNSAWQSRWPDWNALLAAQGVERLPDGALPAVAADLAALQGLHADRFFSVGAESLRRHAPNHLYLGTRFASRTPEAVAACARHCDVVSFNLYVPSLTTGFEGKAFAALDKPAMLTEFHFGSSDRGPFWPGVMAVASEAERGPAYRQMLDSVLEHPAFVGAHWFQYLDQPVTGRWLDGENGHLGLVAITDAPWSEFVGAAAATHREVESRLRRALGLD